MLVDGKLQPLGDARYLLSPGDLYTLRDIPEIVRSGVVSLKIEGRYKDAAYVAATTRAYRQAVDAAWADRPVDVSTEDTLTQVYSRGLGPYFIHGTDHQAVVQGRAPRHRGLRVGVVARVDADAVILDPEREVKPGDGEIGRAHV